MNKIITFIVCLLCISCKDEKPSTTIEKPLPAETEMTQTDHVEKVIPSEEMKVVSTNKDGSVDYTDEFGKVYNIRQEIIDGAEYATIAYDNTSLQMPQSIRWKDGAEYSKDNHKLYMDKNKTMIFINDKKIDLKRK